MADLIFLVLADNIAARQYKRHKVFMPARASPHKQCEDVLGKVHERSAGVWGVFLTTLKAFFFKKKLNKCQPPNVKLAK